MRTSLIFLLLSAFVLSACAKEESADSVVVEAPAADNTFNAKLQVYLKDADGKAKTLASPKGKILLYFSASWCPPCQKFTPGLVDKEAIFKKANVNVVLVGNEDLAAMQAYMKAKKMPWPAISMDDLKNIDLKKYSERGIPSLALLDSSGKILVKGNAFGAIDEVMKKIK